MPMTIRKTLIDNWAGHALIVWRKSMRRGFRGNLTLPSTTLITEMRISSWFNKGRSSTLQDLSLTSFSIQYRSLKTPILSLEPTKWANLFALAILRKKNKLKGRLRRKEINKDMNTWEKQIGVGHELCDGGIGVRGDR